MSPDPSRTADPSGVSAPSGAAVPPRPADTVSPRDRSVGQRPTDAGGATISDRSNNRETTGDRRDALDDPSPAVGDRSTAKGTRTAAALRPTPRGWATGVTAAVLLAVGWWASYPGVTGLGLALTALLACAAVGLLVPAPVTVHRTAKPPRVARLEDCVAGVEVTNAARWMPVSARGVDLVDGVPTEFPLPRLAPGEQVRAEVPIPTRRRGTVQFGPLVLFRSSLADLLRSRRSYGTYTSVLVEPRVLDAVGLPPGARRGHVGADERIEHGGTDLVGMREYQPGDDLRRVHWSTSARRGTLMVRQDADPSAPHLTVLLDDRAASYTGEGFEEAVDVAASLLATAALTASFGRVRTLSGSVDTESLAGPHGAGLDPAVLGLLADVAAVDGPVPAARRALVGAPDVLAVVTGAHGDLADLFLDAAAAPAGVVLVVDDAPEALVSARAGVTVLRGPRAEDLVHGWRTAVAS